MKLIQDIGRPLLVPQDRRELRQFSRPVLDALVPEVLKSTDDFLAEPGAEALWRLEESVPASFQVAASHVFAAALTSMHRNERWIRAAVTVGRELKACCMRRRGRRATPVRFLGGSCLLIETLYLSKAPGRRAGRRRGVGRRGAEGSGCYPVLEALGITNQVTPALSSEVTRQTVRAASFREARQALAERGIELDEKTVRTLALKVGAEALRHRCARIEAATTGGAGGGSLPGAASF